MPKLELNEIAPQPFGKECCEAEVKLFKDEYSRMYFQYTPFNDLALRSDNYLFVGRRGSGKTSLAHFFTFQDKVASSDCIDVDEPTVYESVLGRVARHAASSEDLAMPRVVAIWEYLIWSLIFDRLADEHDAIDSARLLTSEGQSASSLIKALLRQLLNRFLNNNGDEFSDDLENFIAAPAIELAKRKVLEITASRPLIVAIDSLEKYAVSNAPMIRATAALVECASKFNSAFASAGIHVKAFISAEIFPHLEETEISNPSKYVRHPVYLHWRPKDLMRMASWRLNEYFRSNERYRSFWVDDVDWEDPGSVLRKVWLPRFGSQLQNGNSLTEATFPYVLRHTQLRPRQFVILCNRIAEEAFRAKIFPEFNAKIVVKAVHKQERALAGEVLNSYSKVYRNVANIVRALEGMPMIFSGNELDRIASATASEWPSGNYTKFAFRRILAELGIVGRVRSWNKSTGIVEADFEYAIEDRLTLPHSEQCVVHPMFYEKLAIKVSHGIIVYPFPDHPDFTEIRQVKT